MPISKESIIYQSLRVCDETVAYRQGGGKGQVELSVTSNFPNLLLDQYNRLLKAGFSEAVLNKGPRKIEKLKIIEPNNLVVKDESRTIIPSDQFYSYIEGRIPGYMESKRVLYQGSALKSSQNGCDFRLGQQVAESGGVLVGGGMGVKTCLVNPEVGSTMFNTLDSYRKHGGKGAVIIITESLNKKGTKHQEALDFIAENIVVLTVESLEDRIVAFAKAIANRMVNQILKNTEQNDGRVVFLDGGPGTFAEFLLLANLRNHKEIGGFSLEFPNEELWAESIIYSKILALQEKYNHYK